MSTIVVDRMICLTVYTSSFRFLYGHRSKTQFTVSFGTKTISISYLQLIQISRFHVCDICLCDSIMCTPGNSNVHVELGYCFLPTWRVTSEEMLQLIIIYHYSWTRTQFLSTIILMLLLHQQFILYKTLKLYNCSAIS